MKMKSIFVTFIIITITLLLITTCGPFDPFEISGLNNSFIAYVVNYGGNNVSAYSVGNNGTLTAHPGSPFTVSTAPRAISITPDSSCLYVTNSGANNVSAFSIGSNGALTGIDGSPFSCGSGPRGIVTVPLR